MKVTDPGPWFLGSQLSPEPYWCRIEDLLASGIIDPAKVTRSGLTNACGIAGIMLTTQVRPAIALCSESLFKLSATCLLICMSVHDA